MGRSEGHRGQRGSSCCQRPADHQGDTAGRRNVIAGHRRSIERSRRGNGARRQMAGDDRKQSARAERLRAAPRNFARAEGHPRQTLQVLRPGPMPPCAADSAVLVDLCTRGKLNEREQDAARIGNQRDFERVVGLARRLQRRI